MIRRKRRSRIADDHGELENIISGTNNVGNVGDAKFSNKTEKDPIEENFTSSCCFKPKVAFPEDFDKVDRSWLILDPQAEAASRWNKIFLAASLFSLFIDPLFLFSPDISEAELCARDAGDASMDFVLTVLRSVNDVFYAVNLFVRFRTAYVAPSSRVLGRGELVIDPWKIALNYLARNFWFDVLASLPLPQVIIWGVIPNVNEPTTKIYLRFSIIIQYMLRLALLFPLSSKISKATGASPRTAWTGAAYNMMLYYLISHVAGAYWYLLSLQRQEVCWRSECDQEIPSCQYSFFDCSAISEAGRSAWLAKTNVTNICNPNNNFFNFGIYQIALQVGSPSSTFFRKYFYSFWWGLQSLCSIGNNLSTSSNVVENVFTNLVAILGLILFALLIGNIQTYLDSTSLRLEEWRSRRTDTEQWMHHRKLPSSLRRWVRKYDQYKWVATRGIDEEALIKDLPSNLRRKINRHLYFDLLRQVPIFDEMDDKMLDAICERLKPSLCIKGTILFREGDPVYKMLFIIRGNLDSYTTNGGRIGFFNSSSMGPGNFCGEELLTWALDPHPSLTLPSSTRTVKAISDVEAFCLMPEDLKYVATQFKKLHSKKLVHNFRFHSHQWRTWAACYIQAAWRRYKKREQLACDPPVTQEMDMLLPAVFGPDSSCLDDDPSDFSSGVAI
ncbi:hypothetical protein Nepgr_000651 [Nepenthes gracilis]|uniref:Cyclic nucleotide-binding domain-containing protein n=1 Tax=Nepenthes gracilis TaxID=150966 RepID=A0AAD3P436_NEPGR|nr:hypothetical protein Nepgr_000651 [Nepenthes gracilis]